MIDMLGRTSLELRGAMVLGLSVAVKATLLMLVALAVHWLLGRRRPLVRSVIWNACLLGLLLLPVSAATFPRLLLNAPRGSIRAPEVVRPIPEPVAAKELAPAAVRPARAIPVLVLPPAPKSWRDWSTVVCLAYVAVAAALAARLMLSLLAVERLRRSSPAVGEQPWVEALERWRGRLGLVCCVRLARSQRPGVPVVVGWLHPVILLPDTLVKSAAPSTIDAVLLHELTHVRRGDYAWNVLLRLVQAIYWPHPLIWLIGRLVAGVREQACDDLCVSWLGGSATYCATLLEVTAELIRRPWEALGLAMTRSTKLGRRLARIERSAGASCCLLRGPARGVIVVAVLVAFGLLGSVTLVRPRADEPKPEHKDQTRGLRVRVERVKQGEIRRTTTQPGSLHAFESAELFAKVSGYLKQQNVDIGDRVKQGELLAVIDAPELTKDVEHAADALEQAKVAVTQAEARVKTTQNEAKAAEAAVVQAQADAARSSSTRKFREKESARYKKLLEQTAIQQELMAEEEEHLDAATAAERKALAAVVKAKADVSSAISRVDQAGTDVMQAKSGVRFAETNLNRARIMVDYTRVVSPYNGVVTFRGFHPGAFIRAPDAGTNRPLFTVARTDKMRVVTYVPDRDVPYLERGDPGEIRFDALPGQTFRGKVGRFAETEDAQSRTMRTEIDLDNSGNKLREGMYSLVTIVLDDPQPGLSIPVRALVRTGGDGSGACYRIVDGRAVLAPIKLGYDDGRRVQVVEGLKEGDAVAVDPGADGVEDGKPVVVEER